ncbi:MAG: phosphoenolpyruvate--protein phosphotransferase [Chitinispirillaceae bacterium]|nr:phosphoenolpyruvate--protein phosphotransferase [Chitinispirillaceae bacterium]
MSEQLEMTEKRMIRFKGVSINSGRVTGETCLYSAERHKAVQQYSLANRSLISAEITKFDEVLLQCSGELDVIAKQVEESVGMAESEIFITQKHIMNDPKVVDAIRRSVADDRKNVEWAISDVLRDYEEKFASLDNEYLRDRASDIGEIRRRLLDRISRKEGGLICEGQTHCQRGANRIIVAHELTADMIAKLNLDRVLGFVTEYGGITSHAAIIARSLGVPAVSGIHGIMDFVKCGDSVAIDGESGEVYLHPDTSTIAAMMPVEPVQLDDVCIIDTPPGMQLLANASTMEDVRQAAAVGADGIGLLRTEILFIKEERLLDEDEQFEHYRRIVNLMGEKQVTFRMLDVGGDKPLSFLRLKKEDNPYLGWRGSRFLLGNTEIFTSQMRALVRVSRLVPIRVLFPMVVDADQLHSLLELTDSVIAELGLGKDRLQFGAMFEVPSAFIEADEILEMVDFASIGSNDLIQYLFAIDRNNELVSQDYNPEHPVLWKMLKQLSTAAKKSGKPLSICGDIASREGLQKPLLEIGISSLSVPPRMVPRVRNEMARFAGILL